MNRVHIIKFVRLLLFYLIITSLTPSANAERIKDIASIQGVRSNQLFGYGLVIGLDGSGDQTTQTPFTVQSIASMLAQMGVNLPQGTTLQLKNVAAVMVTANLPAFTKPGQTIDVTVSSIGNAKSLRGGTLVLTPLKGVDGQIYAMAQGNILLAGAGGGGAGSKVQVNSLNAGRIPAGAIVEKPVLSDLNNTEFLSFELIDTDFSNARAVADVINASFPNRAQAIDGRVVSVRAPANPNERVAFIAHIEELPVAVAKPAAKVIINARTGSVVMNQMVTLEPSAVAHGNLSVVVTNEQTVSQPNPLSQGQTQVINNAQVQINADKGQMVMLPGGAKLADVVKALNTIGATPQDLLAILQALKAAGALKAELEII